LFDGRERICWKKNRGQVKYRLTSAERLTYNAGYLSLPTTYWHADWNRAWRIQQAVKFRKQFPKSIR